MSTTDEVTQRRATRHRSLGRSLNVLTVVVAVALVTVRSGDVAFVHLADSREALLDQIDPASLSANQLLLAYVDEETGVRGYILGRNTAYLVPAIDGLKSQLKATSAGHRAAEPTPPAHAGPRGGGVGPHVAIGIRVVPAVKATVAGSGRYATPAALANEKALLKRTRDTMNTLNRQLALKRSQDGTNLTTATELLAIVVGGGIVLLIVGLVVLRLILRRWVTAPLALVSSDARTVTEGDLAHDARRPPVGLLSSRTDIEAIRQRNSPRVAEDEGSAHRAQRRNEDLRRSNQELEQFAYVASHDLQEPLRKVTSFVQLLQQRYEGNLDDRADQYIGFAVDGATRMQQLISDLLAFSRVGRNTDRFEVVSMADCLRGALDNLEPAMTECAALVDVAHLPDVYGDQALLISLWQNLIANSIKFHTDNAAARS